MSLAIDIFFDFQNLAGTIFVSKGGNWEKLDLNSRAKIAVMTFYCDVTNMHIALFGADPLNTTNRDPLYHEVTRTSISTFPGCNTLEFKTRFLVRSKYTILPTMMGTLTKTSLAKKVVFFNLL